MAAIASAFGLFAGSGRFEIMKRLGVIGDPIAHSLSPLIHQGWLNDAGLQGRYDALHVPEGCFDSALQNFSTSDFVGFIVTLPHKASALAAAKTVSDAARKIGAANTLTMLDDKTWAADNTEQPGFMLFRRCYDPTIDPCVIIRAAWMFPDPFCVLWEDVCMSVVVHYRCDRCVPITR